ncbi:HAD-IIIC family phosphatase [Rhodocaloribacter sp.]
MEQPGVQTIAVAATFTAEPVGATLGHWLEVFGMPHAITFAPYHQVFQQLLDPESLLGRNEEGFNLVLVRLDDWRRDPAESPDAGLTANVDAFLDALRAAAGRAVVPHLVFLCPSASGDDVLASMEARIRTAAAEMPGVHVAGASEVLAAYPVEAVFDDYADALGHVPFTPDFFTALGTFAARRMLALRRKPYKVIVLDADQTLWRGVCGEDGPEGVALDEPRRALQAFMAARREVGMLLALCTKNDPADVAAVFDAHPEMPLRMEHFAARRINWRPKSENLRAMARELNLGLDAFIFIDDDPIECAEVAARCPEALTLPLPSDADDIPAFLEHVWAFDAPERTAEDALRAGHYRREARRAEARSAAPSLRDFIEGLALEVEIAAPVEEAWPRVAQLTRRTNQFNAWPRPRSEGEVRARGDSCRVVTVSDRFGAYGRTGVLTWRIDGDTLDVDTFLVSCRVLGRGVEHRMMAWLGAYARSRGLRFVRVRFRATGRNRPVEDFLRSIPTDLEPEPDGFCFRAETVAGLAYEPEAERMPDRPAETKSAGARTGGAAPSMLMLHVATEGRRVADIRAAVEAAAARRRPAQPAAYEAPRDALERDVAAMWAAVLGLDRVGVHDNFFALGGHSLAATQIMARIRERFGADLSFQTFFRHPTVAEVAGAIRSLPPRTSDATLLSELLDEIEALSEDEVRAELHGKAGALPVRVHVPAPAAPPPSSAAVLTTLGIVTRDRVEAARRALTSYVANARRFGRTPDVVVIDDSPRAEVRERYRAMLRAFRKAHDVPVYYAGVKEKRRYAKALVEEGLPEAAVRFALFDEEGVGYTLGANRNAMLLHAAGTGLLCVDDDTLGRPARPPEWDEGLAVSAGRDPNAYWFFPDAEAAMRAVTFVEEDLFALHEAYLGADVARLIDAHAPDLSGVPGARLRRMRAARVGVTLNGLAGDCGWGAPFGFWGAPMGYLLLEGDSHRRLVRSEAAYRAAVTSRNLVRAVPRPTLSDGTLAMTTFAGYDLRAVLPPFMPVARGQDVVFGRMVDAGAPGASFLHLPWVMPHRPVEERRFWPGEIFRTAAGVDVAKVMMACLDGFAGDAADPTAAMRALGAHLAEVGGRPLPDFDAFVRERLRAMNTRFLARLDERLREDGPGAPFWAENLRRYRSMLARAMDAPEYAVPLDLRRGRDASAARATLRRLVRRFGELTAVWPEMLAVARRLRLKGRGLALPVD